MNDPFDLQRRSCMTLFAQVAAQEPLFTQVLAKYFGGQGDAQTLEALR